MQLFVDVFDRSAPSSDRMCQVRRYGISTKIIQLHLFRPQKHCDPELLGLCPEFIRTIPEASLPAFCGVKLMPGKLGLSTEVGVDARASVPTAILCYHSRADVT
jgi:hypothetical protein